MGTDKYDRLIEDAVDDYWPDLPIWLLLKAQLYQESHLDPKARSGVGAIGLGQTMPRTFKEISVALRFPDEADPEDAAYAIKAAAYYQGKMRRAWSATGRKTIQRNDLGQASYNAGIGSILKAQHLCQEAVLWEAIAPCLAAVTGTDNARQTTDYVLKIRKWWKIMEVGD